MNKVFYILSFINNYRNKVFKVFYYELFNLVKYLEFTLQTFSKNQSQVKWHIPKLGILNFFDKSNDSGTQSEIIKSKS